jgi:hypothetical protein
VLILAYGRPKQWQTSSSWNLWQRVSKVPALLVPLHRVRIERLKVIAVVKQFTICKDGTQLRFVAGCRQWLQICSICCSQRRKLQVAACGVQRLHVGNVAELTRHFFPTRDLIVPGIQFRNLETIF